MSQITYYWTWAAINPNVDTTYFVISLWDKKLYVDTGNGMNLAQRVLRKEITMPRYLFMTHCHTDHLLGLPHLIRVIWNNPITLLISTSLEIKVRQLMHIVGKWKRYEKKIDSWQISFIYIDKNESIEIYDRTIRPINLYSKKTEQFWFELFFEDKHIVFFWDEAINIMKRDDLDRFISCDRLLCEAFCTSDKIKQKKPYEKAHISSQDTWKIAHTLQAKHLIISHICEEMNQDRNLQLEEIKKDAQKEYSGNVYAPTDWMIIDI